MIPFMKTTSVVDIARRPSRAAALALLAGADLPTDDLTDEHLDQFFFLGPRSAPFGLVGLEICGREALLRSLVVASDFRAAGTGSALVACAEDFARTRGVSSIFLLTTTAEEFFAHRGYRRIERGEAPDSIRSTREYSDICPASSAFMVKRL
jgi:amino-acid N-acetyltransferase